MLTRPLTQPLTGPLVRGVGEGGFGRDPLYQFANLNGDWSGGDLAVRRNVWQYTEDVASNRYAVLVATKQTDSITVNGIKLARVSMTDFYSSLRSQVTGLGLSPFVTGQRYLVSCFVKSAAEQFMWMRKLANSSTPGHGAKLLTPHPRRIWLVGQAISASGLSFVSNTPTSVIGTESETPPDIFWAQEGSTEGGASEVYIGGFQVELISSSYKDGIALIGDSTMEGNSGATDSMATNAREVSVWLGALLNVNVFNRANGGERTDTMDARWATDMSPLAVNCKYAIIQGGVNDFGQSRALADVKASVQSMVDKATADGLTPVLLTCTPSVGIVDVPADEANRIAFNAWLKATYTNVIDIAAVVADPNNPAALAPAYAGDGTHYNAAAKRAVGIAAASAPFWSFTRPTPYQKVTASTYP